MRARQIGGTLAGAVVTSWAVLSCAPTTATPALSPSVGSCPDIEVVFARGTNEPPGIGGVGQPFVDSLRSQVGGRPVGVYAVNYPATDNYSQSASAGAHDASAHVQYEAKNCPNTKMVLGGYSQGAGVIDLITATAVPFIGFTPAPMPSEVADHIAVVAVFGNPSRSAGGGGPLAAISPLYGSKAIDLCAPFDPVCSDGGTTLGHGSYVVFGLVDKAATFAASRL